MVSQNLPAPRVITTSHSPAGTSIVGSDTQIRPFFPFGPNGSSFSNFHASDRVPVSNTGPLPAVQTSTVPRNPPNGVIFCTTDFPPGAASPMHRTVSLDYACILSGEITMVLDGGEERVAKIGDIIVQRGAMHAWKNNTQEPCRMLVVMLGSEKVKTEDGRELDGFFPERP